MTMKPFTQGLEPSCTTPNGPATALVSRPKPGKQHDDAQAEHQRLHHAIALRRVLALQEIRHRERDHREDAGREDGGQPGAEGDQQEAAEVLVPMPERGLAAGEWQPRPLAAPRLSIRCNPAGIAIDAGAWPPDRRSAWPSRTSSSGGRQILSVQRLIAALRGQFHRSRGGVRSSARIRSRKVTSF